MNLNFTFLIIYILVPYFINVVSFRFHNPTNPLYNSPRMKRPLIYAQEDDSNSDVIEGNPYRFVNGYRIVVPYVNVFKSYVKERWRGRPLHEVLTSEYAAFSEDYIEYASSKNKIKIFDKDNNELYKNKGKNVLDHVLNLNEKIFHYAAVHEPVALHSQIKVLENNENYIFVSKPTSIPVYRTGTYRYNTLVEILHRELETCKDLTLFPVHRIDKLVSGIVAFAKNSQSAFKLCKAIQGGSVKKLYVARVKGDFSKFVENSEKYMEDEEMGGSISGKIVSHEGFIHPISKKLSKHEFTADALDDSYKRANTRFRFISYNSDLDESLILCSPITGRTHQIRAHLKFLGHPISNDPNYNDEFSTNDTEYFKPIPTITWEIDKEGNWCIPQLGFCDNSQTKADEEQSKYHVGLNKRTDLDSNVRSGIFLHALRFFWEEHFDVRDSLPKWVDKFNLDEKLDVTKLNLW